MTQSESLLAQGKSIKLSWTKRSTAMPVLCPRARKGTCAQGKCSWCHKAASSLCHKTTFLGHRPTHGHLALTHGENWIQRKVKENCSNSLKRQVRCWIWQCETFRCQKRHACHAKRRWMSPSATPAWSKGRCCQVPQLPGKVPRHHGWLTATKRATRSATPATQNEGECPQVPRFPRETKIRRWISPSATPATQSSAASRATNGDQVRHQTQPSATSATPATQNEGGCRQVPRLWRKTKVDVSKRHACQAKRGSMWNETLATWNENVAECHTCNAKYVAERHACHAKRR